MLQSPEPHAPPSRFADWLELNALAHPSRGVGLGEVRRIFRVVGREGPRHEYDADAEETRENEIHDPDENAAIAEIASEIHSRSERLRELYPFEISETGGGVNRSFSLQLKEEHENDVSCIYIFCLLVSSIRLGLLNVDDLKDLKLPDGKKVFSDHRFGYLFQICASIALGGYLLGEVVSFGFPRRNKTRFLTAMKDAWERFGAYEVRGSIPQGAPLKNKDAGIDLLGWVHFADNGPAKMLVIGQVASGLNWNGKSVSEFGRSMKNNWFVNGAFEHFMPAMFIPFDITDADNHVQREGGDLRSALFGFSESSHGMIFDRERIVFSANRYFLNQARIRGEVDRADQINDICSWNDTVRPLFASI